MREGRSYSLLQRVLAFALTLVMVAGYVPVTAAADQTGPITTVADPDTTGRVEAIYGTDTQNAGKISVDKSVSAIDGSDDFLVTVSQAAQVAGLSSKTSVPVDVVFVLDTSNSMSGTKVQQMVVAANNAIKTLMESNENNRVGVVAFSGPEGTDDDESANVLTPLGHYEAYDNHIQWTGKNGTGTGSYLTGRGPNAGTRRGTSQGTNIHAGVALGGKLLAEAANTKVTVEGMEVTRIPFLVLMSDGDPTYGADGTWYAPLMNDELGHVQAYDGLGFLPALTAAYYKGKITEHYFGTSATEDNRCYVYSIGLAISNSALAVMTMNPAGAPANNSYRDDFEDYWASYTAEPRRNFNVQVGWNENYTITAASIAATENYVNGMGIYTGGYKYNDGYYSAENADALDDVFSSIVSEINKKSISSPTKVSSTPEFSGYVTFTDPIGEFMEVKTIQGIHDGTRLYAGGRAKDYLNGEYTDGLDAFKTTLRKILVERLRLTGSNEALADELINGRMNVNDGENAITWWGHKIADSDESHVQVLGYAEGGEGDMLSYIKSQTAPPTFNVGSTTVAADMLCRSYLFYGTASGALEESQANHEYMHFMVRIQQELVAPYRQTVVVSAPASLLSVDEVMVTENEDGTASVEIIKDEAPVRVLYEVGLRSDINPQNVKTVVESELPGYASEAGNMDGEKYQFYTNDWDRTATESSHHRAMAKATFEAALDNPFYAYQENELIYTDISGTLYTGDAAPVGNYYYARTYYAWGTQTDADGNYIAEKKVAYIPISIPGPSDKIQRNTDGTWYVVKGTYTASSLVVNGEDVGKQSNNTQTASIVSHPHRTDTASDPHYTVLLGNNGRLSMAYQKSKDVYAVDSNKAKIAGSIDGKAVCVGDELLYEIQVYNNKSATATATVTDKIPAGTEYVEGSASPSGSYDATTNTITWTLADMAAGSSQTVSFKVKVTEDVVKQAIPSIDNQATVAINNEFAYDTNITKNPPEGKTSAATDNNGGALEGDTLKVGDQLTYTIRYANDEASAADITITDVVPAGTTYKQGSATNGGQLKTDTEGKQYLEWTLSNVPAGTSGTVSFAVYVDASAKVDTNGAIHFVNDASIKVGDNDPRVTNKTDNPGGVGDISLTKTIEGVDSTNDTFTLILTERGGKLSGDYAVTGTTTTKVTFTNGVGRVTLKAGETVTVKSLPLGATIEVLEDSTGMEEWKDTYQNDDTDEDGATVVVTAATGNATAVDVSVKNTFITLPVTFQLNAVKRFQGTFPAGEYNFGFQAVQCDENGNITEGGRVVNATATKGEGNDPVSFSFSSREFTEPTELYYLVSENTPADPAIIGDSTQYMLKLMIEYAENSNQLTAVTEYKKLSDTSWTTFDWTDAANTPFVFTNKYPVGSVTIEGTKILNGRKVNGSEFGFELLDATGKTISTTNTLTEQTDGSYQFRFELPYGAADVGKTYNYRVREIQGTDSKITYDDTVYDVAVAVVLNADGTLTATPEYTLNGNAASLRFENTYNNGVDLTLSGEKTYLNYDPTDTASQTFHFEVVDNDTQKVASTASVTVAPNKKAAINFTTIHYSIADMADAEVNSESGLREKTYTYTVKEIVPGELTADPNMVYSPVTYTVSVKVTYDHVTGAMTAAAVNADANGLNFTNYKNPAEIKLALNANKTTSGNLLPDGLSFSFQVVGVEIGEDGTITRKEVEATGTSAPTHGGTSTTSTETVMVPQADENGEPLTDENGEVIQIAEENTTVTPYSETTPVTFTDLVFTKDDAGKTFYYIMEESNAGAAHNGVTYDITKYLVEVKVSYSEDPYGKLVVSEPIYQKLMNGDGTNTSHFEAVEQVAFSNEYEAKAHLNLTAKKELAGRDLGANEFDFALERLNADGSVVAGSRITGTHTADGQINFATLNFSTEMMGEEDEQEIKYRMYEIEPANAKIPGITYDKNVYTVTVKLIQTEDGGLTAELYKVIGPDDQEVTFSGSDTGVTFTNTYSVQTGVEATIEATKQLTGRDTALAAGEFNFVLYRQDGENWKRVAAAQNDADGKVSFTRTYNASSLAQDAFDENGDYTVTYRLGEEGTMPAGVTQVTKDIWVKVVIHHDNAEAEYECKSVTYYSDETFTTTVENAVFVNNYKAGSVSAAPEATKRLLVKGADGSYTPTTLTDGQFSFAVFPVGTNGNVAENAQPVSTGSSKADGSVTFSNITFDEEGTYVFEIREVEGTDSAIVYSDEAYRWTVTVTDNEETGLLEAAESYTKESEAVNAVLFTNHQSNGQVKVPLELNKTVKILDAAGTEVDRYDLLGSEFDFEVLNAAGTVVANGTNGAAVDGVAPIIFEDLIITLADFEAADVDENNEHEFVYTVKEITPKSGSTGTVIDSKIITVTVTVTKDEYKNLSVTNVAYAKEDVTDNDEAKLFVNTFKYTSATLSLTGTKGLNGKELAENEFQFQISGGNLTTAQTVQNTVDENGNGFFTFKLPDFVQPGEYVYTVEELDPAEHAHGSYAKDTRTTTVVVTVTADANGQLHAVPMYYSEYDAEKKTGTAVGGIGFSNLYTPDPVELDLNAAIDITKQVTDEYGTVLELADLSGFQFELVGITDKDGKTIVGETNDDGVVDFDPVSFNDDTTYTFYIRESEKQTKPGYVVDSNVWMVEVKVSYNGGLTDVTYTNAAGESATAASGQLYIQQGDVKVTKVTPQAQEVELMTADAESTQRPAAAFTNVYKPTGCEAEIEVTKSLTGRDMRSGEFTFRLMKGDLIVAEATNDASGNVTFKVPYTGADMGTSAGGSKTFAYTVVEVAGNAGGVSYDSAKPTIEVKVTDTEGKLSATVTEGTSVSFRNTYAPAPVDVTISAVKQLEGRPLTEKLFTFQLKGEAGTATENESYTEYNAGDGSITFEKITYTAAGVYEYTLTEVAGTIGGMEYDETEYAVTVTVTDDLNGQLHAAVGYERIQDDGTALSVAIPSFTNGYEGAADINTIFKVQKVLKTTGNRTMKAGEFAFELLDETGSVIKTSYNAANGEVVFNGFVFDEAGTFKYTIREVKGTEKGMTYDGTKYLVTVTVTDDLNGQLHAAVSYSKEDGTALRKEDVIFTNTFTPEPVKVKLEADKVLKGRDLKNGEFKFTAYDSNGDKAVTGTNDAKGKIVFEELTFTKAGVYKYSLKENRKLSWYVTFDRKSYDVTVTVTETDGVLKAEVTYPDKGITFKNYYDPNGDLLPNSGDETPLTLLMGVAATSAMGLIALFFLYGKNKKRKQ